MSNQRKILMWVCLTIFVGGAVPVFLFWQLFLRAPEVSVAEAKALLAKTNATPVLVDVRPAAVYANDHLAIANSWPYEEIMKIQGKESLPGFASGQNTLLLLCETGLSSARAAQHLRQFGVNAINIRGGTLDWSVMEGTAPFRPMAPLEQVLAVSLVFLIKPFYMVLCFVLIVVLWRRKEPDLVVFRWGLVVWWLGENACSVNYLLFHKVSHLWEYLHNYGMAAGFSLMAYALLEGLDHRIVKFTHPKERCALLGLCRSCYKYTPVACSLDRLFQITVPAFMAMALMPLAFELKMVLYGTKIFGTRDYYSHMISCQLFENRYCALLSFFLLTACWLVLLLKRKNPMPLAKILFAAALGPLSFGLMRLFLYAVYSQNLVWFDIWEEYTEMLFIIGIAVTLWVFRRSLLAREMTMGSQPNELNAAPESG